jgi:hypothetical protein
VPVRASPDFLAKRVGTDLSLFPHLHVGQLQHARARAGTPAGAERARVIYAKARPNYHPIATATLDGIVLKRSR